MVRRLSSFHLTVAGTTWKGKERTLSLNLQCLTCQRLLYWYHTGMQNLKSFTEYHHCEKPTAYCLRECYLYCQLIHSGRLVNRKGWQKGHPSSMRFPTLPETEKATGSAFGSRRVGVLSWLIYGSLQRETNSAVCLRLRWPSHLF